MKTFVVNMNYQFLYGSITEESKNVEVINVITMSLIEALEIMYKIAYLEKGISSLEIYFLFPCIEKELSSYLN